MLLRFRRLKNAIDEFCRETNAARHFSLNKTEWTMIEYVLDIIRPFNFITTNIGASNTPTIPHVFQVYDHLFETLHEHSRRLRILESYREYADIKTLLGDLLFAIDTGIIALTGYYEKSYKDVGSIFAVGALLNPDLKDGYFCPEYSWLNFERRDWKAEYVDHLKNWVKGEYSSTPDSLSAQREDELLTCRSFNHHPFAQALSLARLSQYRTSSPYPTSDIREDSPTIDDCEEEVKRYLQKRMYSFF
jgi:hypothetical protein